MSWPASRVMDTIMRPRRNRSRAEVHQEYRRAYKACNPCRQRKAKCVLINEPNDNTAGLSCARCRRQQRNCVFDEEKAWARKKKATDGSSSALQQQPSSQDRHAHQTTASGYGPSQAHGQYVDGMMGDTLTSNGFSASDPGRRQSTSNKLASSVMRTVVSSGNDALNILFEAASHGDQEHDLHAQSGHGTPSQHFGPTAHTPESANSSNRTIPIANVPVQMSNPSREVLSVWEACRFVKMGWFSARESVAYVDLFFKNMSPLSPILTDFYSKHENNYWLVTQEPVLCCTILLISSRYHVLPGLGGTSRAFFIHHRLWQHCQHLIMRVMFGQEKSSKAKTRTIGTIEALLLMSEWHPRSLHFPPECDGWDSDMILTVPEPRDTTAAESPISASNRWREDVIEPAKRSDRMSWMLLGSALSLAHELGVFETDSEKLARNPNAARGGSIGQIQLRRQRIPQLLYVFINQLALRLGCISIMPHSLNNFFTGGGRSKLSLGKSSDGWFSFMRAWVELTKLAKSVTDMLFPSVSFAKQQLQSGRYIGLLDHCRPLLDQWKQRHFELHVANKTFANILSIEYEFVRVYTNSFGMQAVVERALAEAGPDGEIRDLRSADIDDMEREFIQDVIDGCCQILRMVINLAETGALRFSPVRLFLRVTSSSVFLFKALNLGVQNERLEESLDILDRCITALKAITLDDVHFPSCYATILEVHLSRLRHSFFTSSKTVDAGYLPSTVAPQQRMSNDEHASATTAPTTGAFEFPEAEFIPSLNDITADDWLSLALDPSLAPFCTSGGQYPLDAEGEDLDFIWSLSA